MSRAEELANFLEFHFTEYERCHPNDAPMCESAAAELRRLAQVEAEHAALKEELEAEREETKRWRNAAKWEQEIRKQAEMIADKAVTESAALLKAISDAEPVAWLVCSVNKDKSLSLEHAAPWKEAAHEHINDAINEYGLEEAASWIVREVYTLNGIKP